MCTIVNEEQLNQRLAAIEQVLHDLKSQIESNNATKTKGIGERLRDAENRIDENTEWRKKMDVKIVAYSSVVAMIVFFIMWVGDKLIHVLYNK